MKEIYRFAYAGFPCIFLFFVPLCGAYAQVQTARNIQTGPNSYGFYEYLPAGYSTNHAPYPLMVFLSGEWQQGNGTTMLNTVLQYGPPQIIAAGQWPDSFKVDGRTFQFVIISPQFTIWEGETDIDDVINYAVAHYNVDPKRVYLTGYSAGGGMTWAYAGYSSGFANKLAAIVPVSAAIGINDGQAHNIAAANVPVYTQHNIDDSTVPYAFCLANVAAVNHATPPPTIPAIDTIFPNRGFRHNAWTETYYAGFVNPAIHNWNIYQWMLHYSRIAPNTVVPNTPDTTSSPPPPPPPPPPQPVALTAYYTTLSPNGKAVNVEWSTAQEIGNKYFIVQRSADSTSFTNLDTTLSTAKYPAGASYQYTDNAPLMGNNFYRLERVDSSGHDTLYSVLKVVISPPSPPPPTPQPVALTAYYTTLSPNGKAVNVEWTTAKEIGNKYFVVQRSADSTTFTNLDTTLSIAKYGAGANYGYTDNAPLMGNNFYRLERVDSSGHDTLYSVLKVVISPPPPPPTTPQPVALTMYTATVTADGKAVNVNWTTAKEIGNKYFIVQRGADSTSFTNLDTVLSAAKNGGGASYQYTDIAPLVGNNYYRLERIDSSGHDTLYSVLRVWIVSAPPPPPVTQAVALTTYTATVTPNGKAVDVDWSTAQEIGNKYFIVQRSTDSTTFTNLDTVLSAAKNGGGASYQYMDTAPPAGRDFYRLERVDSSGHDTLYTMLAVQLSDPTPPPPDDVFLFSPNPASGLVKLHLVNSETGELHVSLTDMQGRILRVWVYQKQSGVWDESIDVAGVSKGAYILRIQGIKTHEVRTILKE